MTSPERGSVAWGLVVFVLLAGMVAGLIAGASIGASAAAPDQAPSKPGAPGADFPDQSRAYFGDLTLSEIKAWMKRNAYECEKPKKAEEVAAKWKVWCWPPDGTSADAYLLAYFDGDRQVRSVEAKCVLGPLSPSDYCQNMYQYLVRLAFPVDSKTGKQAMRWAVKNVENDAATVIGGVEMTVVLQEHTLEVYPAG